MISLSCPKCGNVKDVIKHGTTPSGSARCRCRGCGKTFTPQPNVSSRTMTDQKEQQILLALQERISQRGIARMLKVGRQTIRAIRKKGRPG